MFHKNKVNFIVVFFIFISVTSIAQTKVKFGVNAGATYFGIRGNEVANKNKYDFNYLLGTSVEFVYTPKVSLLLNLNYERKSFKNDIRQELKLVDPFDPIISGQFNEIILQVTQHYLVLPIICKISLGKNNGYFVSPGIYGAYRLATVESFKESGVKYKVSGLFNDLDFGLNLGVGKRIAINSKNNLNIEIRNNLGLINTSKVPVINNGSVKNNSFNLILNWEFNN